LADPSDIFGGGTGTAFGYTVRYASAVVAAGGNGTTNSVTGGDGNRAWTAVEAAAQASVGQVVFFMDDGDYTLSAALSPSNSGTTANYIVWAGIDNPHGSNSNGGQPKFDQSGGAYLVGNSSVDYWWIENFEFANPAGSSCFQHDDYNRMHNCYLHGSNQTNLVGSIRNTYTHCRSDGANWRGFGYNTGCCAYSCTATGNGLEGFNITSTENWVVNSISHNNGSHGIEFNGYQAHVLNCTVDGNGGSGVFQDAGSDSLVVVRSIITNNSAYGIRTDSSSSIVMSLDNHFHNNTSGNLEGTVPNGGQTTGDPLFMDYAGDDFRLTPGSPASNLQMGSPFVADSWGSKGAIQTRRPMLVHSGTLAGLRG